MKMRDGVIIFQSRNLLDEMHISPKYREKVYREYLGNENLIINDRVEAVRKLSDIINRLQEELVGWITSKSPYEIINKLYKIHDECFRYYTHQKEARKKIIDYRIDDNELNDTYSTNRNLVINIINSVNLWLENCLLFQDALEAPYDGSFELDKTILLMMALYGAASRALSLLNLSKKLGSKVLFYGVRIEPYSEDPVEPLRYHPVIYFNTLLTGNQDAFSVSIEEYQNADSSEFGVAFTHIYGVDFILALRTMRTFQKEMLKNGKYAYTVIDKKEFVDWIDYHTNNQVDGETFFNAFVLTKEKIESQKKEEEPIIWVMATNKNRLEICPFLCLKNDRIAISYTALDQAVLLWMSIFGNGSMAYSIPRPKKKDELMLAIENRATDLSRKLVDILRNKLRDHYVPGFDDIDVKYDRIFGRKSMDYGDFDLVFYAQEVNELFLIEAKYFSDSLNNSGFITDYEKLFNERGYYYHCRNRYNLVIQESNLMKEFIGIDTGKPLKAHFLFVSSKPLEIELQDEEGIVTFLCLSIFDDYLEGKLLPEIGDEPIRPVYII